jgi:hypothetical protein
MRQVADAVCARATLPADASRAAVESRLASDLLPTLSGAIDGRRLFPLEPGLEAF